jgi:Domain of unknown function (DUF4124)
MNMIHKFLAGCACMAVMAASGQWQWTDKDGRKVYSDRAPPSDVPDKNILKRPGGKSAPVADAQAVATADAGSATSADAGAVAAAPAANASGAAAPKSSLEKEVEAKKKLAQDAEAAKKKTQLEASTKAKVEDCARAKQAKATLDSGARIGRTNDKGEREIMDDTARAAEAKRVQGIIEVTCKG